MVTFHGIQPKLSTLVPTRLSIAEFIVGNTVEFVNVTYRLITCFLLRSDDIMRKPENLMKSNQKVACI